MTEQINSVFRDGDWNIYYNKDTNINTFALKKGDKEIYVDWDSLTIETNYDILFRSFNGTEWMQEHLDMLFEEAELTLTK